MNEATAPACRNGNWRVRCGIYTRKSHEHGLDQAFNSLHAQREACEAYIASQKHEGWMALPNHYDDGGVSGATMNRPGLQRLLADIQDGRIDVIVVYKVDRLTRALSDFARIVEVLDRYEVSFVSVTQQFNTTSSMGRLTLNVLLSFAQFEREVTGERIRDKIAASKKRGLWMGGNPPLGYDVQDRKLIVNEPEAGTVRYIFRLYRQLRSVRELRERLGAEGVTSKRRVLRHGRVTGGKPINRGALYYLLRNRIYRGQIVHKDKAYPGEHEAIIDRELWDAVQATLTDNTRGTRRRGSRRPSLLTGLLVDEQGEGLTPTHAVKKNRRYRYYVSRHLIIEGKQADRKGWRIPAADLEGLVVARLREWLGDPAAVSAVVEGDRPDAAALAALIASAKKLAERWPSLKQDQARAYLKSLLRRVVIRSGSIQIEIAADRVTEAVCSEPDGGPVLPSTLTHDTITLAIPAVLQRAGMAVRLIVPGAGDEPRPDPSLMRLLVRAFGIRDRLDRNPDLTIQRIAEAEGVVASYATRLLRLSFLAPDIVAAILEGRPPLELTANKLMRDTRLPLEWTAQRQRLGFPTA